MRLKISEKEELMSILNDTEDLYDILESEESALNFISTLTENQQTQLVQKIFGFMQMNQVDLSEPLTPSLERPQVKLNSRISQDIDYSKIGQIDQISFAEPNEKIVDELEEENLTEEEK